MLPIVDGPEPQCSELRPEPTACCPLPEIVSTVKDCSGGSGVGENAARGECSAAKAIQDPKVL